MKTFPIPSSPAPSGGERKPEPVRAQDEPGSKASQINYGESFAKGGNVKAASYAAGGPVLGRTREFLKEPSPFRSSTDGLPPKNQLVGEGGEPAQNYAKTGKGEQGRGKCLRTVTPR
jgi:hypothetical protein